MHTAELYENVGLETEIMNASSHRLIQMLFEKCLQHINLARLGIINKNKAQTQQAVKKSRDILLYLQGCLNFNEEEAQSIAILLDSIYFFVEKIIHKAAIENNIEFLNQATLILTTIKSGWDGISQAN